MKFKKSKMLTFLPAITATIAVGSTIVVSGQDGLSNVSMQLNGAKKSKEATGLAGTEQATGPQFTLGTKTNGQYKASSYYYQNDMPVVTNANGPVLLGDNGRSISAYDWYGNPTWFLNLNSKQVVASTGEQTENQVTAGDTITTPDAEASYYTFSNATSPINWSEVGTKIVDIAYLAEKDFLYVLTDTSYLFSIKSSTGVINYGKKLEAPQGSQTQSNGTFKINKLSFIDFNNTLIGWDSTSNTAPVYAIDTQKLTLKEQMSATASGINSNKYIFDILPLDVGYNIAITSTNVINEASNFSVSQTMNLEATIIQDNGNNFNSTFNGQISIDTNKGTSKTISLTSYSKYSEIYSTTLKRSGSNVLIVGDKIYNIILNKSAMNETIFKEISLNSSGTSQTKNTQKSITKINSAYVDKGGLIYFKDDSTNIWQISLDDKINATIDVAPQNNSSNIFQSDQAKKARIYPVQDPSNIHVGRSNTGYIASPDKFVATGFRNGSMLTRNFTSATSRPELKLRTQNVSTIAPSSIKVDNFTTSNAIGFDNINTEFFVDDISGELYVKSKLKVSAWYDTSLNAESESYVIAKWNCAKIEEVTKWVTEANFKQIANGIFAKRSPDQISDQDVTKYAEEILILPEPVKNSENKSINIIVTERKSSDDVGSGLKDTITLKATIQYENSSGVQVSYTIKEQSYKVKKEESTYKFKFFGGKENEQNIESVDISVLGPDFNSFKNTLPSLIKPTPDNLEAFIEIQDKYPTDTRRVMTVTNADDEKGQITIAVHYNNLEASTLANFSITYTGLTTLEDNKVNFKGDNVVDVPVVGGNPVFGNDLIKDITTIREYVEYNKILATEIKEDKLSFTYDSNLSRMGFVPEMKIVKDSANPTQISTFDAEYGSIAIELDYTKSYSERLGITFPKLLYDKCGLTNGKVTQRYIGFLPIGETYNIKIKSWDSDEVQKIVQNNNVNANISTEDLLATLDVKGFNEETVDGKLVPLTDNVQITAFRWEGEDLLFDVHAQSSIYKSVSSNQTLTLSWSPKFAAIRQRNLIISATTSVGSVALVAAAVAAFMMRRMKIRKLLK